MRIKLEKRGIRALGVSEIFRPGSSDRKSTLAGVVIRSDLVVDGIIYGSATLEGDDATTAIIDMYQQLHRNDINVIILGGVVISLYNIINVDQVFSETQVPVISVTFEESEGLELAIKHHFPDNWTKKIEAYRQLGAREPVNLKTGYKVYIRAAGADTQQAKRTLDKFTLQGALPEPIRLAHIAAKAKLQADQQRQHI